MNRNQLILILALGGAGVLASIPAALVIRQSELNAVKRDFHDDVNELTIAADLELRLQFAPLEGLNGLFTGSETVTQQEFRRIAQQYLTSHPEIQSLQYIPYIPHAQRQTFEAQQKYFPFQIKQRLQQGQIVPAQKRNAYFPIALVEPLVGNESALGFDLGSEPQQRQILEQSRDSGRNLVSAGVNWEPDPSIPTVFLAISPIYRGPSKSSQERQDLLQGFVAASYRVEEMLVPILIKAKQSGIALTIYDQTDPAQPEILAKSSSLSAEAQPDWNQETPLSAVQGRSWVMIAQATDHYIHSKSGWFFLLLPFLGVIILCGGGMLLFMRLQQSAVLTQEEYFQSMANQSPAIIWMTEVDKHFSFLNRTWLAFTGRSPQADMDAEWLVGIHPEDRPKWQQLYETRFDQKETFAIEHRLCQPDGSFAWMLSIGKPRYNGKDEFCGYIGTSIDVSQLKQADVQCQLANQELLRSNQDLEQMAAVLSHDMREPLRKIKSFTELIEADYLQVLDEQGQRYFSYVIDSADRMQAMIDAVLAYARLESGEQDAILTNLNQVIDEVQEDLSLTIQEQDAVIEVDRLPNIMVNAVDIRQVFQNLLINALKFRGEAAPFIQLTSRREQDTWLIMVSDNGIGIAPDHLDRIFVMLQRLHDRQAYEGNGIGLAICKKILERYRGSIWAESKVGEGTTFYLQLPIHPEDCMENDEPFVSVFDF